MSPAPRPRDRRAPPPSLARWRAIGVFGPDTPPAPDQRLTLRYRPVCFHAPPAGDTPNPIEATFSFMTAAPVEMELQATELAMTEKGIVYAGPARHMIVRYHLLQAHTRIVGVDQEFVAQLEADEHTHSRVATIRFR